MSKVKSSFTQRSSPKLPSLGASRSTTGSLSRSAGYSDGSLHRLTVQSGTLASKALNFGALHTKAGSKAESGSNWTGLLKSATSGGSGVLSDGLLSATGVGLIVKLFGLFGGGKSSPPVPTQFQSPVPQQHSIDIGAPGSTSSVALGVHPLAGGTASGIYRSTGVFSADSASHSAEVVQIVKLALLTSSALNDVISEI